MASNVVSAWRWRALARWLGAEMRWPDALRWYFQAIGLNALLPGAVVGGDVYRAVVLQRTGQGKAASSLSVLLDRLSGLWMLCAIGALGAAVAAPVLAPVVRVPQAWFVAAMLAGTALWIALPWVLLWWLGQRDAARLPAWLQPLLQAAHEAVALERSPWVLCVHDWSRLKPLPQGIGVKPPQRRRRSRKFPG